ncbi:MAG: extracellular solute-binding protein [Pseudomonadota bacterium]
MSDSAAAPSHGVAIQGEPALPPDFRSFTYVNPEAPKGGSITYGERGSFDSFNPYIRDGRSVWGVRAHVVESLMERSWDEPFSVYGLLAESIEIPEDRSWVAFQLRSEARFSSGAPVTIDDVIWSWEILRDKGKPYYRNLFSQVQSIERQGEFGLRVEFKGPNQELPLTLGLMPVLERASWEDREFGKGGLDPVTGSGPYVLESFEAGRRVVFRKNPDYWGADLPINKGRHNFDEIEYLYFQDKTALWEAFKVGDVSQFRETDPAHWAEAYGFPAVLNGRALKGEIPHQRASGMNGFVFNTRNALFDDRRVREAFALAFDYEWINARFFRGGKTRIQSYFSGSALGFEGAAEGREKELLAPFAGDLPPGTLEDGWRPPRGAGDGRNRTNLRQATKLLAEAGWTVQDGVLRDAAGAPFEFEILLVSSEDERIADIFVKDLRRLGIVASKRLVESAQYQARLNDYDFDMIVRRWWLSLSPGEEQRFYWGSGGVETRGTRNYMGANDPAIDAMVDALLVAKTQADFQAATRALDRVLSSGIYVIPFGYETEDRFGWWSGFEKPDDAAIYGYRPDVWWWDPSKAVR